MKIGFRVDASGAITEVFDVNSGKKITNLVEITHTINMHTGPLGEVTLKFLCEEVLLPDGYQVETDECRCVPVPGTGAMFLTTDITSGDGYD